MKRAVKPALYVVVLTLVVLIVDQLVKAAVLATLTPGEPVYLIGRWFKFLLVFNSGAAFSMGSNSTWLFTTIQIAFIAIAYLYFVPRLTSTAEAVGLGLIAGGAAGNLVDRLFRPPAFFVGHVVDYISVGRFAIFNIADAAITCGVVLMVAALIWESRQEESQP